MQDPGNTCIRSEKNAVRLRRPIFIVSSPRAGSSLLFESLALSPSVWTIGSESHALIEGIPKLHPAQRDFESNRLIAEDADPETVSALESAFLKQLRNRDGHPVPQDDSSLRLLEKTPKNSLRVPFLAAAFPDAAFIYLYRDPRETVSSMLDAWRSGRFITYPYLPGWPGPTWSLLLVPGWRELCGRPLAEIVARQWEIATRTLLDDLESLDPGRWVVTSYDRLVSEPGQEFERLCKFLDMEWDCQVETPLPLSRTTLSSPEPDKWRHNATEMRPVMPLLVETAERARQIFAISPAVRPARRRSPADRTRNPAGRVQQVTPGTPVAPSVQGDNAFRSIYTASLPQLLERLGISLLASTYQSGRIIAVRADSGGLNTHFRAFQSPMGMALGPGSLAIATQHHVWEYRNQPAVAAKLQPPGKHDACFLPRACNVTGDIRIHEVAFAGEDLWVVATRFSCLATLDSEHSFRPRWRPAFVSGLAPEDRCHLNGLAVVDGRVRYVTALGRTDTPQGWRERKADGGCLIDVDSGEIIVSGLSMPHSPRWYAGRLWFLESGKGTLALADPASGKYRTIARLPGFTRGLSFAGNYAFIGISQVRESVFEGVPISSQATERLCGVWAVDLTSGRTVGFLRFEGIVQEIFDVLVLPTIRYPEIAELNSDVIANSFILPSDALDEVPASMRG